MQYMLLIYNDPATGATMPKDERNPIYAEYGTYTEELQGSGKLVAARRAAAIAGQQRPSTSATARR